MKINLMIKKTALLFLLSFSSICAFAQEATGTIEMADGLRSSGKIYVVVGVLTIIFTGIVIFLISIDRKLSKLEKEYRKSKEA